MYTKDKSNRITQPLNDESTWCGATYDEWAELYESATIIDPELTPSK